MIDKGMKLDNTEGMIDASVFPVNYFTLKQVYFQYQYYDHDHGVLSFQFVINFYIPWFISLQKNILKKYRIVFEERNYSIV